MVLPYLTADIFAFGKGMEEGYGGKNRRGRDIELLDEG
jgi:hypothetical protein